MFTGLVTGVGHILHIEPASHGQRILIDTSTWSESALELGESIAVNGVCLTVAALHGQGFFADLSPETLRCTTFGQSPSAPRAVNLERSLRLDARLGGHCVSGHIDGIARIRKKQDTPPYAAFEITAPRDLMRYIACKGSVCLDGVSLTINTVSDTHFTVQCIAHTLAATILNDWQNGHIVNLEVDRLARYVERLLDCREQESYHE